jgi:large subunit ribosomal protein L18
MIVTAHSRQLEKYGWQGSRSNLPAAYLTGFLLGRRAKQKKIRDAVLDLGLYNSTKGSKLYAALKGALDGGLQIPHSPEILPSSERLAGEHIAAYAKKRKADTAEGKKESTESTLPQLFQKVKERIEHENRTS